jgi:uncharacterized membrane protein YccC
VTAWWAYLLAVAALLAGIYAFVVLARYMTGFLSSGTDRTANTMYDNYADSLPQQRRYARKHGGRRQDDESRSSSRAASEPRPPRKAA